MMQVIKPKFKLVIGVHENGDSNIDCSDAAKFGYFYRPKDFAKLCRMADKIAKFAIKAGAK